MNASVIVFARAPRAGRVKTRLEPLLGADGAARLHARMMMNAIRMASAAGNVELHCAPTPGDLHFRGLRAHMTLYSQGRGDIGERMQLAFRRALRRHRHVVLIGSDCPALRVGDLRAAVRALQAGNEAVFSPAEDGGYALIGLRRLSPRLFERMAWGGAEVMAQTRTRLRQLGWRWKELRTVWDVDRPEDVARLRESRLLERRRFAGRACGQVR